MFHGACIRIRPELACLAELILWDIFVLLPAFLISPEATFELTGIFNRADQSLQFPEICTAVRFIYRLGYRHDTSGRMDSSRLPYDCGSKLCGTV